MKYILGGLSVVVVIYSLFFIIYRLFEKSGIKFKKKITKTETKGEIPSRKECFEVFGIALSARVVVILISIMISLIFINHTNTFDLSSLLNNWVKWDAYHYIRISYGYSYYIENGKYVTLVFFPLYSFFMAILKLLFTDNASGLIVSNLAFSISNVFIYKLVSMDYGKKTAKITLLILNIFPFAFFFSAIMSESVFLLFSVLTLYYIRKHNWVLVGLFGLLCALSRSLGVFIIIPAMVELIEEYQIIKNIKDYKYIFKIIFTKVFPLLLIPLGFGVYLYLNYRTTGEWFYFLRMQKEIWFQTYNHFFKYYKTALNMFHGYDLDFVLTVAIPQIIIVSASYIVLFFNVRKSVTMYSAWLLVNIIVNTSMSWPLSACRYFICALPLFIFIADYLKKRKKLFIAYIVVSSILFAIYFVSYLMGSNIV